MWHSLSEAECLLEHHLTIPRHDSLRVGTLASILDDVATHLEITRDELLARLFG